MAAKGRKLPVKRITKAKAERLVAALAVISECEDCPDDLRLAMEDVRATIDPWCDR